MRYEFLVLRIAAQETVRLRMMLQLHENVFKTTNYNLQYYELIPRGKWLNGLIVQYGIRRTIYLLRHVGCGNHSPGLFSKKILDVQIYFQI